MGDTPILLSSSQCEGLHIHLHAEYCKKYSKKCASNAHTLLVLVVVSYYYCQIEPACVRTFTRSGTTCVIHQYYCHLSQRKAQPLHMQKFTISSDKTNSHAAADLVVSSFSFVGIETTTHGHVSGGVESHGQATKQ